MKEDKRILIVDDEPNILQVLEELLADHGYDVETCLNGSKAMALFEKDPFPLVMIDIRMEGMSGFELTEVVKNINKNTHVVIITSHVSVENAVRAMRLGANEYIIKPFDDLQQIVHSVDIAMEKVNLLMMNEKLSQDIKKHNQELIRINMMLRDQAVKDGLTGVYNYRYFQEVLTKEISLSKRNDNMFSVILFDVDNFKEFNDTYGHLMGDDALKSLAQNIDDSLRASDFVARYGGEEFVVILPETNKSGAMVFANKLREQIGSMQIGNNEHDSKIHITISGGIATFGEDGQSVEQLMRSADEALYKAKHAGKNCIVDA